MQTALLALVIATAAVFAFLNGFRDAAASVALPVRTRSLTPTVAVVLAAAFNFMGVLLALGLTRDFTERLFQLPPGSSGLAIMAAGVVAACGWGIYQWWRGYPSSSTHALISGVAGAAWAAVLKGAPPLEGVNATLIPLVVLPLLLSPIVALALAYLLVFPAMWLARYSQPNLVHRRVRKAQAIAGAAVALGHGLQDGQRTTAVLVLSLGAAGLNGSGVPPWVLLFSAVLMAAGTLAGGWRISYTLGTRLVRLDPMRGLVAQATSGILLFAGAIGLHLPLATMHTVTSAIVGAGINQHSSRINSRLAFTILGAWIVTPLACGLLGLILYLAVSPLL